MSATPLHDEMLKLVQMIARMSTPLDADNIAAWKTRNPHDAHLLEGDDGLPLTGDDLVDAVYEHVVTGDEEASAANSLWSLIDHAREMLAKFSSVDGQSVAHAEARV